MGFSFSMASNSSEIDGRFGGAVRLGGWVSVEWEPEKSYRSCAVYYYWVIWRYRNDVVHRERQMRKDTLFDTIRECALLWVSNRCKKLSVGWTAWFQNPISNL